MGIISSLFTKSFYPVVFRNLGKFAADDYRRAVGENSDEQNVSLYNELNRELGSNIYSPNYLSPNYLKYGPLPEANIAIEHFLNNYIWKGR